MTFTEVRAEYEQRREAERMALSSYLLAHKEMKAVGLRVVVGNNAGKGRVQYTSSGRIPAFDLRNWKWVEVKDGGKFNCVISLNMPDIDPSTKNVHSLYDRVGLVLSSDPKDWVYTDIDLPLGDKAKEQIAQLVLTQFKSTGHAVGNVYDRV